MKMTTKLFLNGGLFSSLVRYAVAVLIGAGLGGCDAAPNADDGAGVGAAGDVGQVSLSLAVVPADIQCLRLTAEGPDRTVTRPLDIPAGQPVQSTLTGIPLGPVVFTAQAFSQACADVTATTIADWVSDPETVSVTLAHLASVELTMHRNGRAKVSVDFPDEPICSPAGVACASSSTCCSHSCSKGVCKDVSDGGAASADAN